MNQIIRSSLLLLCIFLNPHLCALSIVYNFRIAQVTKQPITDDQENHNTAIALLFEQYYKTYDNNSRNFLGGLGAFIYNQKPYYIRVDFAVSDIIAKDSICTTFSGTETDDILFTAGRNFLFSDRKVLTVSGLFGIPTHQLLALQHPQFGNAQFGTGIQLDGSYPIGKTGSFFCGARYVRFFARNAKDDLGCTYNFTIGNLEDILLAYRRSWPKHGIELGYTSRTQFGAAIYPNLDDVVERANYIRSNFYAVYKYKFLIRNLRNRFLVNIAYGFDHRPKDFGSKYILTLWASWNINF